MFKIHEAAKLSGLSTKMIRNYERLGLLRNIARSSKDYRLYHEHDIHNLKFIHRARQLNFPLQTIKKLLALWQNSSRLNSEVHNIASQHIAGIRQQIQHLESIVAVLQKLVDCCGGEHQPSCPILEDLAKN